MKKRNQKRSKSQHRHSYRQSSSKPWNWLVIGLLIGFIVPGIILLKTSHNKTTSNNQDLEIQSLTFDQVEAKKHAIKNAERKSIAKKLSPMPLTEDVDSKEKPKHQYEFYNMLSNEDNLIAPKEEQNLTEHPHFALQVASFKNLAEADHLKAELIVMGFDVFITHSKQKNNYWNRVNIGPYDSARKAQKVKKDLQERNIQSNIVEIK